MADTSEESVKNNENEDIKNPVKYNAILKAAIKIFAKKGFQDAKISEIAEEAQVSESTIYQYFGTKEGLLFSIPENWVRVYLRENLEILKYIQGAANKLRTMIHRHIELYDSDEDYANVTMLILKGNRNFLKTDSYKVVQESARLTTQVLEEGIRTGEFHPDMNVYLVRSMIWGTIEHLIVRKSLLGKPKDLVELANDITSVLLKGIMTAEKSSAINIHVTLEHKD